MNVIWSDKYTNMHEANVLYKLGLLTDIQCLIGKLNFPLYNHEPENVRNHLKLVTQVCNLWQIAFKNAFVLNIWQFYRLCPDSYVYCYNIGVLRFLS